MEFSVPVGDRAPLLVLASASPRRAELLRQVGLSFQVWPGAAEEETWGVLASDPDAGTAWGARRTGWTLQAVRARARAAALRKARPAVDAQPDAVVIAADTMVMVDGVLLGKPSTSEDAENLLRRLSGRTHHVTTGVVVAHGRRAVELADDTVTAVRFRTLRDDEILRYVATGEPMDKAGAYGIQGRAALFVERVEGDYFGVVGLPLVSLARLLDSVGVQMF
ncbi:MAG: Maf family protein [Candidatus Methylomirabilaceae bacterium]